jgi:hypothetical protein
MYGLHNRALMSGISVLAGGTGVEGGFHGGGTLLILKGSHPVAPATDE